jgi:cytochrome b
MEPDVTPSPTRVRVWDVPTRLVHWMVVCGFAFSWWTAETGRLEWHRWSGYSMLGLLLFRIYWGFFGSSTARFAEFLRGPSTILRYLRGTWNVRPGHNPLGALSVASMLILLVAQISFGLFAVDVDGLESGPLSLYVSFETGRDAAEWHERTFDVLTWLAGLHVAAIVYYRVVRREKLAAAMFHGMRTFPVEQPSVPRVPALRFVIGVVLSAAFTWIVARAFQF